MRGDLVAKEGGCLFRFNTKEAARFGIMKKLNQDLGQIQWFEVPNHYTFHYVNSWEDTNELG